MIYLDTSAALKVVVAEPESPALAAWLARTEPDELVAGWLLHAEMHCAAERRPQDLDGGLIDQLLDAVALVDLTREDLRVAARTGRGLRTLDALHLAVALRVGVTSMVTYDVELAAAARSTGISVVQPT